MLFTEKPDRIRRRCMQLSSMLSVLREDNQQLERDSKQAISLQRDLSGMRREVYLTELQASLDGLFKSDSSDESSSD